jgi:hypothetical protein
LFFEARGFSRLKNVAGILRAGREFSAYPFLKMYFVHGWFFDERIRQRLWAPCKM